MSPGAFTWDAGPTSLLLPAVVRDLFRRSGRPVEKELDLVPLPVVREHRFEDGTRLVLPTGSRADQAAAVETLGAGLGEQWAAYVDAFGPDWELLRRDHLERPVPPRPRPAGADPPAGRPRDALPPRQGALPRRAPRLVAAHPFVADGHDLRDVPGGRA